MTELSADFRRVIDEVAHRLFPEASPDEYQDEHFDELNTIVPVVDHGTTYFEELDEYSLDAMDTSHLQHIVLAAAMQAKEMDESRN